MSVLCNIIGVWFLIVALCIIYRATATPEETRAALLLFLISLALLWLGVDWAQEAEDSVSRDTHYVLPGRVLSVQHPRRGDAKPLLVRPRTRIPDPVDAVPDGHIRHIDDVAVLLSTARRPGVWPSQ